jgi:hypothetical protein
VNRVPEKWCEILALGGNSGNDMCCVAEILNNTAITGDLSFEQSVRDCRSMAFVVFSKAMVSKGDCYAYSSSANAGLHFD